MKKVACIFPGQGSQFVGMGKDFYETYAIAKKMIDTADHLLGYSLSKIMFEGPEDKLKETENCQLALFVHSMAIYACMHSIYPELQPKVCAGLSLGEWSAVCATNRLMFKDALLLVQKRAQAMQKACENTQGTMAAILGLDKSVVDVLVKDLQLADLWVANYNCPGQTVVSGGVASVEMAMMQAKQQKAKRAIPLKVAGAFHSGFMSEAQNPLKEAIDLVEFQPSSIGLVMNVTGDVVKEDKIKEYLIKQITSSVCWEQSIMAVKDHVDLFIEIGAGKSLSTMNRQMGIKGSISIAKVEDMEQLQEVLELVYA